jgi:hypothetical protein
MSSGKDDYQEDDIVFAMVTGYPWWPGFIAEKYSKKNYKVTFFGDFSYAELSSKHIKPFVRGLKKADPNNKDLTEAIQSAKRVVEGQSTIVKEHEKVEERNKKSKKTKAITKKKKTIRKSKRTRKSASGVPERSIKTRAKRRMKAKIKEDICQSMIQDTTHKRRADRAMQKKREAKLGKSMDQKLLTRSDNEEDLDNNKKILDELIEKKSNKKKDNSVSRSKKKCDKKIDKKSKSKENKKKKTVAKKESKKEEKPKAFEIEKNNESEDKKKTKSKSPVKSDKKQSEKIVEEKPNKSEKKDEKKIEVVLKKKANSPSQNNSPVKSEVIEKSIKIEASMNEVVEDEKLKGKFNDFEKDLLSLLNKMQNNKPIPSIEENLKEWFNQISRINQFSPIVSTDIGKHLSQMSQICLERINEKQTYNKILHNIENLKNFIIERISKNFFNIEHMEELDSRIHNEDSIITTKKNDSSSKIGRVTYTDPSLFPSTLRTPVDPQVRLRIQKKLAKAISKMVGRKTIKKETCLMLGKRIEEFLHVESQDSDEMYRENVVRLLEFMEKSKKKFIEEFIFQKNNKCDIQLLRIKIIQLLRTIN